MASKSIGHAPMQISKLFQSDLNQAALLLHHYILISLLFVIVTGKNF